MHKYLLTLVLGYTGLIGWLSLAKVIIPVDVNVKGSDKIGHLLAYFVFTIVWFLFFFYSEKQPGKFSRSWIRAAVLAFLFGVLMEFFQAILTDYRSPEWNDVLANTSGIVFAVFILKILKNKLVSLRVKYY
ncbi:VanZ family protein [uncultured Aquimarina sp.]|uniref:VanZ family protein n=1 Tax=uncultured Aquimarina sp. TaxID=575652 RepID=UPI0026253FF0|nr:VanZ family protein [uncultured Aquimarina sp.]